MKELLAVQSECGSERISVNADEQFSGSEDNRQTPIEIAMEIDEDGFTTAKKLYEWLGLDEGNYSRWVKSNILDNPYAEEGADYSSSMKSKKKGRGQFAKDYRISASFAKKLAMSQHTERGELARVYFLMCEQKLVEVVKERERTRLERVKCRVVRKTLTDLILESGENERMKGHAFSTYTSLIYKCVFGKTVSQMRKELGIGPKDNIRNFLEAGDLAKVQKAERLAANLLELKYDYDGIKEYFVSERGKEALDAA